jgi:hypothetical protein
MEVQVVNVNGSGATTLASGSMPDWSPDGQKIVYARAGDIYTMNASGSGVTDITNTPSEHEQYPAWSPDNTRIAYESYRDGNAEIYTMNTNGTARTRVTNNPNPDYHPTWQPLAPGYARPRGASPINITLVPAYRQCTSGTAVHGEPLDVASCTPPQVASDYLTVGTPDANGAAANSAGLVILRVICNPPAPRSTPLCTDPGDQSDVELTVSITDVRKSDLTDYGGELRISFPIRMTDHVNGYTANHPATASDTVFGLTFPCTANADQSIGSTCSTSTTADAVLPGVVPEDQRAIWGLGQVQVFDGGSDGDADTTGDNTLFATQGLFAP